MKTPREYAIEWIYPDGASPAAIARDKEVDALERRFAKCRAEGLVDLREQVKALEGASPVSWREVFSLLDKAGT